MTQNHWSNAATAWVSLLALAGVHCASDPPPQATQVDFTVLTSAEAPVGLNVSEEIRGACNLSYVEVARAPKFDVDKSALHQDDAAILAQIAKCVTTGPLSGRAIQLVGRTDPRGNASHNVALGERRADAVKQYLVGLGVRADGIATASRGSAEATGTDEKAWQRDRRVDVYLR